MAETKLSRQIDELEQLVSGRERALKKYNDLVGGYSKEWHESRDRALLELERAEEAVEAKKAEIIGGDKR